MVAVNDAGKQHEWRSLECRFKYPDLFERTVTVDSPLTLKSQLLELQSYLKTVGAQFLQRVDAFAAIDLRENMSVKPGENADINVGLECFLFVEQPADSTAIEA